MERLNNKGAWYFENLGHLVRETLSGSTFMEGAALMQQIRYIFCKQSVTFVHPDFWMML